MSTSDLENLEELPEDEKPPITEEEEDAGEEVLGEEEEKVEEEEVPEVLLSEDFISKVFLCESCSLPEDIIEFDFSFGYDCKRHANICVADKDTVIFASGNLIHFFNIVNKELWFRRSSGGGGIGHITKNPLLPHIAIGENGPNPLIIIYEWPSMEIVCVLREGTTQQYTHLNYSPDGELLSSQGGDPDYMLTIWNWRKSKTMLRCKAYSHDVLKIMFSPYVPGQLSSGGSGHIKFWKIARTFTGLKLMGELGRFGKTEMSDILGFLPLPDEKVVSGCEWGNMLVWEEGLIKVEVLRKNRKTCHMSPIVQFEFDTGELATVGMDGVVKFWYFETIDQADPPEEDRVVEVEPLYEFEIGHEDESAQLMSLLKRFPEDPDDSNWIAQDGNGGIWQVQLDINVGAASHNQILFCHAGPITGIVTSPWGTYLASIGKDGRVTIYDYIRRVILARKRYPAPGCCILWLPISVEKSGNVIVAAFGDGTVRVLVMTFREFNELTLIEVTKPHRMAVTALVLNDQSNILVTGSDDATIFIYAITPKGEFISLVPLGFVNVPSAVTFITWNPKLLSTALVCCQFGHFLEIELPFKTLSLSPVSYELNNVPANMFTFKSVKSQIRRNNKIRQIEERKEKKREKKMEELEKIKAENPGLDIDEDTYLEDSDSEEELEPLYFPEIPNPIMFAIYTDLDTVWISVGGYDSGYIYEYDLQQDDASTCTMIPDADDVEIHSFAFYHNNRYLVLGMNDGQIRVNRVNPDDFRDLNDYLLLAMHDNINGRINSICFSCDYRYMFSCGDDGNIFSYIVLPEDEDYYFPTQKPFPTYGLPKESVPDIEDLETLSLEETKQKAEYDRKMKVANERKSEVTKILLTLSERYRNVLEKNQTLAESQRLSSDELEIDSRITSAVNEIFMGEMKLLERKLAYKVAKSDVSLKKMYNYFINVTEFMGLHVLSIDKDWIVSAFRNRQVLPEYEEIKQEVELRIEWAEAKGRLHERPLAKVLSQLVEKKIPRADAFLKTLNIKPHEINKSLQFRRMLNNYLSRRRAVEVRDEQWTEVINCKPDPNVNHPFDVLAIELAEKSIGDYKLKSADDYTVPRHLRITTLKKYNQMLETRVLIFNMKSTFNRKVVDIRKEKLTLIDQISENYRVLDVLQREIGPIKTVQPHLIPSMNNDIEMLDNEYVMNPGDTERRKLRLLYLEKEKKKKKKTFLMAKLVLSPEFKVPIDPLFETSGKDVYGKRQELPDHSATNILRNVSSENFKTQSQISLEELEKLSNDDMIDTPWENELRKSRTLEKRGQQERLCTLIAYKIAKFDEKVKALGDQKRIVDIKAKFLELHLLKLNQEMIILNKFEAKEQFLSSKVLRRHREKNKASANITDLQSKIDHKNKELMKLSEKENELTTTFMDSIVDSKFAKYLRKIYKKKYKPPKVKKDDEDSDSDSSSSDESSSEDEEDAKSIDSREIGPIKLDETIRPEGCEVELYELAFTLRSERHQIEILSAELRKQVEGLLKELEAGQRHMKIVEKALQDSQNDLEAFQRVKQQRLNEVEVLVILKLSALTHFIDRNKLETLDNTLLFSKGMLSKLNSRETELIKEMEQHKLQYMQNRHHLRRMKQDCAYMTDVKAELNSDISEALIHKFGCEMSLDDLEEALLKRMIARLRSNVENFRMESDKKLEILKKKISRKQMQTCCELRLKTEKLNILHILESTKQVYTAKLRQQNEHIHEFIQPKENVFVQENRKLLELVTLQTDQIIELKDEIYTLSHKTKPPVRPKIRRRPIPVKKESEESEEDLIDLAPSDERLQQEETTEMYMQGLLNEIMNALPEGGGEESLRALTKSLEEGIQKLPLEDQCGARQMLYDIIQSMPSYTGLVGQEEMSSDAVKAVREIIDEMLDDPIRIRKIVEGIVEGVGLVPSGELQENDVREMIQETVNEMLELHSSNNEVYAQELAGKVAKSLETVPELPPDSSSVKEIILEILKTNILDKLSLKFSETEDNDIGKSLSADKFEEIKDASEQLDDVGEARTDLQQVVEEGDQIQGDVANEVLDSPENIDQTVNEGEENNGQ